MIKPNQPTAYIPVIDGLRAVAVISVILFHAGFTLFSGGFVGVDIFFVISGFLITTILIKENQAGNFSILNFYERRARRIIPALFLVISICTLACWFLMQPKELVGYAKSLIAVPLFVSNIYFNSDKVGGYFGGAADEKPLLHTWSLAVEEQYYLFFPLLIWLLWKFGTKNLLTLIVVTAIASLGLSEYASRQHWLGNFYLIPTRAWELLIGSILAFVTEFQLIKLNSVTQKILSNLGLAFLLLSILLFDNDTRFPSLYALLPTLGAAFIIASAHAVTLSSRLLSSKLMVGVGLISYSAYLLHQPLFVLTRVYSIHTPTQLIFLMLTLLTFAFAYISWRFIERPFRNKKSVSRNKIFSLTIASSALFIGVGLLIVYQNGFPSRLNTKAKTILAAKEISNQCIDKYNANQINIHEMCTLGSKNAEPSYAIIGDSHANAMLNAFDSASIANKTAFYAVTGGWCAPLLDFGGTDPYRQHCRAVQNAALTTMARDSAISTVILIAEWPNYTEGYRWGSKPIAYYDAESTNITVDENPAVFSRALKRTIQLLKQSGKKIIIVEAVPEYEFNVADALIKHEMTRRPFPDKNDEVTLQKYHLRNKNVNGVFKPYEKEVTMISTTQFFCDVKTEVCRYMTSDGMPLYSDGNHVTMQGAKLLVPTVISAIKN